MLWHHLDVRGCCCLRRILLNYAVFNPDMGYCQGMSDLVAPLLTEIQDESDTFWCFVGLMENTIFISSPRDEDMERQLVGCFSVCLLWVVRMSELIVQRCFTPQLSDTSAVEVVSNNFCNLSDIYIYFLDWMQVARLSFLCSFFKQLFQFSDESHCTKLLWSTPLFISHHHSCCCCIFDAECPSWCNPQRVCLSSWDLFAC